MKRSLRHPRAAILCLAMAVLPFDPGAAAAQLELSMFGGLFVPTNEIAVEEVRFGFGDDPSTVQNTHFHENAGAFGGRLTLWLGPRFGVEAAALYSSSNLKHRTGFPTFVGPGQLPVEIDAHVLAVTGRGLVRFGPPSDRLFFHALAGMGVIGRGGDAYESVEGGSDLAVSLGGGFHVRVAENLSLRFDVESYLSKAQITLIGPLIGTVGGTFRQETKFDSELQADFVFLQSVVLRL